MATSTTPKAPAKKTAATPTTPAGPKQEPEAPPEPVFTAEALQHLDRTVLMKGMWTDAELRALIQQAQDSNVQEIKAAATAVAQQSAAAYVLNRQGYFDVKGNKASYGIKIGKSATRVGDYIMYGTAAVKHQVGFDTPLFDKLKAGASGGHRERINRYLARKVEDFDKAEFERLLDEAIAEEVRKANERKEKRAAEKEAKENDALGGKEHSTANVLVALGGIMLVIQELDGQFTQAECDMLDQFATAIGVVSTNPKADEPDKADASQAAA